MDILVADAVAVAADTPHTDDVAPHDAAVNVEDSDAVKRGYAYSHTAVPHTFPHPRQWVTHWHFHSSPRVYRNHPMRIPRGKFHWSRQFRYRDCDRVPKRIV